jgi:hypothetical protein
MEQKKVKKQPEKTAKRKPSLVGWSLTDVSRRQIQKIAAKFRVKKVKAIHKIFDILFNELAKDKDFRNFVEMYDTLQDREVPTETSIYSSFDISDEYMENFKNTMYDFEFVDRSPFLRIVVDYIYQKRCEPITEILDKLKDDLKEKGYKVKHVTPALMGDIFIQVENPPKPGKK